MKFVAGGVVGNTWWSGVAYIYEFTDGGVHYLGASPRCDFTYAIVEEAVKGKELEQLRNLERLAIYDHQYRS